MTDESVKEEFEKGKSNPENTVTAHYQELISEYDSVDKAAAIGYYMKCKTAERLAKIEVLESAKIKARECYFPQYVYDLLDDMIAELKEGGE